MNLQTRAGRGWVFNFFRVFVLALMVLGVPLRAPGFVRACSAEPAVRGDGGFLPDEPAIAVARGSHVSIRRTTKALSVYVFNGTVLVSPPQNRERTSDVPIIVTTELGRLEQRDAQVCLRVQGDRMLVTVITGVVQLSTFASAGESGGKARVPGLNGMSLRAGDRAEVFRNGVGVEVRLEYSRLLPAECGLKGEWGVAGLDDARDWA